LRLPKAPKHQQLTGVAMSESNFTPTQADLHNYFDYKDGVLYWKVQLSNGYKIGNPVGSKNSKNYLVTSLKNKAFLVHRLIFAWHYGHFPKQIDHIDGNPLNNNIENLRICDYSENNWNSKIRKDNLSGIKNVYWQKSTKKWAVALRKNKKYIYLGCFKDLELAELVATEARNKYHGKFARHN
jgi:hypothetical protein